MHFKRDPTRLHTERKKAAKKSFRWHPALLPQLLSGLHNLRLTSALIVNGKAFDVQMCSRAALAMSDCSKNKRSIAEYSLDFIHFLTGVRVQDTAVRMHMSLSHAAATLYSIN